MRSNQLARVLGLACIIGLTAPEVHAQVNDVWSSVVELRGPGVNEFIAPVHAQLLPDGKVMFIGFRQTEVAPPNILSRTGTTTAILDAGALTAQLPTLPTSVTMPIYAEPVDWAKPNTLSGHCIEDTLFCSGHTLLDNGDIFVAGGRRLTGVATANVQIVGESGGGLPYACVWDRNAPTLDWAQVTNRMVGIGSAPSGVTYQNLFLGNERYYPTVTRMGGKKALITGSTQVLYMDFTQNGVQTIFFGRQNLSVELFTPGTSPTNGTFSLVSPHEQAPPETFNRDYSHTFLLPNTVSGFNVLIVGEASKPVMLKTSDGSWSVPGPMRTPPSEPPANIAPNHGATSVMLPIWQNDGQFGYSNGSVLSLGGDAPYLREVDVWDPNGTGTWSKKNPISVNRHHASSVLLPDGNLLVCCGHGPSTLPPEQEHAEYIDVSDPTFPVTASSNDSSTTRGYHTVTLLLPCGNVLVGGGRAGGTSSQPIERASIEFLSPPYVQDPNRPTLASAPGAIFKGRAFNVTVSDNAPVDAVLISLGSMTHSFDMNQRMIQLETVSVTPNGSDWTLRLRAPTTFSVAPRGYYMLFVRNANRTPSKAKIVHLRPAKHQLVDPPMPHP